MEKLLQITAKAGCLVSIVAPLAALVLYPRAKWLFAFVLLGIAIVVIAFLTSKGLTSEELADLAERIFYGRDQGMDVDGYEHANPKDQQLRELWGSTMAIGGLPEEWIKLDETKRAELLEVIQRMKALGDESQHG